ncbi:TPA: hypothetical protein HA351_15730 [Methanosarcinaceae archaeon]|nr:hypothetical protein [Methanosarcinaceae archaeon]
MEWVGLYLQGKQAGRAELAPSKEKAESTFKVDIDSTLAGKAELRAVERCNIHGTREKYSILKVS